MTDDDRDQGNLPWQGASILTWLLLAVNLWGFVILGPVLLAVLAPAEFGEDVTVRLRRLRRLSAARQPGTP